MGMQSFFFHIDVNGNCSDEVVECIKRNFETNMYSEPSGKIFKKRIACQNKMVVLNTLVIDVSCDSNDTVITIEACFANYEKAVQVSYDLYRTIKGSYPYAKLAFGEEIADIQIDENSIATFQKWLLQTHETKYNIFIEKYGNIEQSILPCDFYDYVGRNIHKGFGHEKK